MITGKFTPMGFPVGLPGDGMMAIFKDWTPESLKTNFLKWCDIGLREIGTRKREKEAIVYVQTEFIGLINAFYCSAASMAEGVTDGQSRAYLQGYYANYYKAGTPHKDIVVPPLFCHAFFEGISFESARSIVWFLMGVVIAKKASYDYHHSPQTIFNLFERYEAILAYSDDWAFNLKDYSSKAKKH